MSLETKPIELDTTFNSLKELKHAVKHFTIQNNFETRTIKSEARRYQLCCKADDCLWVLHARPLGESALWKIVHIQPDHNCLGVGHTGNSAASADFLASVILEQVRMQPDIKPKNIKKDIQRIYNVEIPYGRVWAAKEAALNLIHGTHEESYANLPKYCEQLVVANPGTFLDLESTETTNQFRRLFLCYDASAAGFVACKPLLGIDGTHLKSKFQGILLTATGTDAQGQLFPLAFGVVDIEDKDNWLWFLTKLREVLEQHMSIAVNKRYGFTLLSDRQKGLIDGVSDVFPLTAHGYCLKHLEKNLKTTFKNKDLSTLLWKAAVLRNRVGG
jgi:hypothetical protein